MGKGYRIDDIIKAGDHLAIIEVQRLDAIPFAVHFLQLKTRMEYHANFTATLGQTLAQGADPPAAIVELILQWRMDRIEVIALKRKKAVALIR